MPPVGLCLGTSPSQEANSLPLRNVFGSATFAAIAVAMIGPIPGMVARRWLTGLLLCHARTCASRPAIRVWVSVSSVGNRSRRLSRGDLFQLEQICPMVLSVFVDAVEMQFVP